MHDTMLTRCDGNAASSGIVAVSISTGHRVGGRTACVSIEQRTGTVFVDSCGMVPQSQARAPRQTWHPT
eukprot:2325750-Rhodomonas_salina.4